MQPGGPGHLGHRSLGPHHLLRLRPRRFGLRDRCPVQGKHPVHRRRRAGPSGHRPPELRNRLLLRQPRPAHQGHDPRGKAISFSYDEDGNLTKVKDERNATPAITEFTYNDMNLPATRKDPLTATESFICDGNGNLTGWSDQKGQRDLFARRTARSAARASGLPPRPEHPVVPYACVGSMTRSPWPKWPGPPASWR